MDRRYPYLTPHVAPLSGRLRTALTDFCVEEVAAYPPSAEGDHLFVEIEKKGLTTPEATRRLAAAMGANPKEAGWAGLKDRHAVTRQWLSFLKVKPEDALAVSMDDIRVIQAVPHTHKLKVGHLRGNRFEIRLREVSAGALESARGVFESLATLGCPNYFGEQRFGRDDQTYTEARRWLVEGGRPPRSRFKRKLYVSTLQSHVFNEVVAERTREQTLNRALAGDVLKKEDSGGLFVCEDEMMDQSRVEAWEVSPTGPMFGVKMRGATGVVGETEDLKRLEAGLTDEVIQGFGRLGLGTRRPLRVRPEDWSIESDGDDLVFQFYLGAGSYATTLLREICKAQ